MLQTKLIRLWEAHGIIMEWRPYAWGNQPQPDKDSLEHDTPPTENFNVMQSIMQGAMGMFQDANMAPNL